MKLPFIFPPIDPSCLCSGQGCGGACVQPWGQRPWLRYHPPRTLPAEACWEARCGEVAWAMLWPVERLTWGQLIWLIVPRMCGQTWVSMADVAACI